MHCSRYTQSSSPIIIPKSITLQFVFPHFWHLKSCPEKSFSAAPNPICRCVIFSVIMCVSSVCGSVVSHFLHIKYLELFLVIVINILLHVGQNWIVIYFCREYVF